MYPPDIMSLDSKDVASLSDEALEDFFANEAENIAFGTHEQNLCARLGLALRDLLPEYGLEDYYVDAEYNRNQDGQVKTIINDNEEVVKITCDLILHSRGEILERDNILAYEIKKSSRSADEKESDRNRLIAMTKQRGDDIWPADGNTHLEHVCGYLLGTYVELDVEARSYLLEHYRRGKIVEDREGQF
jgi:hypothetical protein